MFFGGANGLEAVQAVLEECKEFGGVLAGQDVLVGAEGVEEAGVLLWVHVCLRALWSPLLSLTCYWGRFGGLGGIWRK
jgi:hypothetical protein